MKLLQVKPRLLPKSVGCSKTFRGHMALRTLESVHQWLEAIGVTPCHTCSNDRHLIPNWPPVPFEYLKVCIAG